MWITYPNHWCLHPFTHSQDCASPIIKLHKYWLGLWGDPCEFQGQTIPGLHLVGKHVLVRSSNIVQILNDHCAVWRSKYVWTIELHLVGKIWLIRSSSNIVQIWLEDQTYEFSRSKKVYTRCVLCFVFMTSVWSSSNFVHLMVRATAWALLNSRSKVKESGCHAVL